MTGEEISMTLMVAKDPHGLAVWRLNKSYTHTLMNGLLVTVPAGYRTNFGTIPRLFHNIIKPIDLREAALVHDYLCGESIFPGTLPHGKQGCQLDCSRWLADCVIYDIMRQMGFSWSWRAIVFACVRSSAIWQGKV